MRPSRQFRPLGLAPLEDRVVLSHVSVHAHHVSHGKVVPQVNYSIPTPDNVVKGNVGDFHGLNIAQTIQSGQPVYEQLTTNFTDGSTQNESKLIVPNQSANSITTTRQVNLRNNQGSERIVDVATTTGTNSTGTTIMHNITTTLPGGGTETETETELVQTGKTLLKGTIILPGGSTKTFTGTVTTSGNKTTTDETVIGPDGFSTQTASVVTLKSELSQGTTSTTTYPDGTATTSNSNTFVLRLTPPA